MPGLPRAALLAAALLCLQPAPAFAADWQVISEREGIVVSRRPAAGRAFPQLRAIGEVPGTPYEVLAILTDVPAYVKWLPDCVESRTVRVVNAWQSIVYMQTDAPWPVANREAVVNNRVDFIDPPSKLRVSFSAISAPEVRRRRGIVRMKLANGFYAVEAIDNVRSRVHYEVDADPSGTLPARLITLQSTRNPYETIAGLRRRLTETRGQYDAEIAAFPR